MESIDGNLALLPLGLALAACSGPFEERGTGRGMTQTAEVLERDAVERVRMRYLLALPEGYDDSARRGERWPLLVFLHGVGECGDDLELVKRHGPPKLIAAGRSFPCIVASPQTAAPWWSPLAVHALVDELSDRLRVDEKRIYLTGLSLGGFGTWSAAIARPERFAALVPVCGGGDWVGVRRLKHVPVWAFHGRLDESVPARMTEDMIRSLERAGGHPRLTIYDDLAHDCWTRAYDDPALWTWLLSQHR